MRFRFTQYLVAMRNAQRFLEEHGTELGRVNNTGARRAFDASITRLAALAEAQSVHNAGAINHRAEERRSLRRFCRQELQPLLTAMRAYAGRVPGIEQPPQIGRRASTTSVVLAARAVARQAEANRQFFVDLGFADDFLNHFVAETDKLVQRVADKGLSRVNRRQATLEIEQVTTEARRTLRVITGLVEKVVDDPDSAIRVGWQAAMAVVPARKLALVEDATPETPALKAA